MDSRTKRKVPGESVIQFCNNNARHGSKGGRVSTSCKSCSRSKKKCIFDGTGDKCQLCAARGIECSLKRSRETGSRSESGSGSGSVALAGTSDQEWLTVFLNEDAPFYNLNVLNTTPQSPEHRYVTRSLGYEGFSGMLYGILGEYDPLLRDKFFQYDDNDECCFHEKFFRRIEKNGFSHIFAYKKYDVAEREDFRLCHLSHGLDFYLNKVSNLHGYIPALVTLYVKFILPSLPIFDGTSINSVFSASAGAEESVDYGEFSDPLILLLLYRLTYRWFYYDTTIPIKGMDIMKGDDLQFIFGEEFFSVVWNQINRELIAPTITTLKSMILFYHIISFKGTGYRTPFESNLLSSIVNTSYIMGLHLDCSGWNVPKDEKNLRKRLWWTILVLDIWNKLANSLPTLAMNNSMFECNEPTSSVWFDMFDDIDDFFPESTIYSFYLFSKISYTTSKMVKTLFGGKTTIDDPEIQDFDDILDMWLEEYSSLSLEASVPYSSVALCYAVAKILIFRLKFKLIANDMEYNRLCFNGLINLFGKVMEILEGPSSSGVNCFWYNFSRSHFFYLRDVLLLLMVISSDKPQSLTVFRLVRRFKEWLANNARTLKIVLPALVRINITISSLGKQVKRLKDEQASKLYN
ncbi:fungal trans super family conserved domain [Kluyveromyces marxianus]|nr:fungal trans super family conserved domain [Kluyveromyces marxianus]